MDAVSAVCNAVMFLAVSQSLTHRATLSEGLDNPARLAIRGNQVFVADTRADKVVVFDLAGTLLQEHPEPAGPTGIAVDAAGNIYVSRRDDAKVAMYDPAFTFIRFVGQGVVSFVQPTDMAVDDDQNRLYVVDSGADRVYAFQSSGSLALILGQRGGGFGQFKFPSAIAVDAPRDRILVADQDNFRVQVFTRSGVFLFKFGYRIRFLPDGQSEGWFPRTAGLAVDAIGRIYVVDALMGTVRAFTSSGAEIATVVGYGSGPGQLQAPTDAAIDATGAVYVANGNVGTVEIYDPWSSGFVAGTSHETQEGSNESIYDLLGGPAPRGWNKWSKKWLRSARSVAAVVAATWDAPHTLGDTTCARCHDVDAQPGGDLSTIAGQFALCNSCHTGGGHALESPLRDADRVSFGGSPPESGGRSHSWGDLAANAGAGSIGPPPQSEMAHYLSSGRIKCATCHDQHSHQNGRPYLRSQNTNGQLCRQCHVDHIGHTPSGNWQPTCQECHDMHNPASANLSLVNTKVHNRTLGLDRSVVLTERTGANSFDDGDPAENNGLCQVCHTATSYHRYDGSGAPHNNGQDCISCHPHETGFLPVGGDCLSCHAGAQDNGDGIPIGGRRAVVAEFPVSDAHAHYGAELNADACVVCHDQTTHMDGYVDLAHPDGGPAFRFLRPSDLTAEPDLSDFCAACHDPNGAQRLAAPQDPFGNGNAPSDVASRFTGTLQWEEQYGDFCFGSEGTLRTVNSRHDVRAADQVVSGAKIECLNCHGSHTAGGAQPLVDPFATRTPWVGSGGQFCLACHDGGAGPLDPGFPPEVRGPVVDVNDSRWAAMGFNWSSILGGACLNNECSSLRGIDSCEYVEGPWYVDYSWTHSAHAADSKRGWNGYSGAPDATLDCMVCHDPHGSSTPANPAGNPYMIRDVVSGTAFVDDSARTLGFNGPPWTTFGVSRPVVVGITGQTVDWGGSTGLCEACHADWRRAYDWHDFCTACQTCHGHGMSWGEADWVDFNSDTPCPIPNVATLLMEPQSPAPGQPDLLAPALEAPPIHQLVPPRE